MDEIAAVRSFRSAIPEQDRQARETVLCLLQQRRPRRRFVRSRRVWILVAAALAAFAAASSALGWTSRLIDAIAGEPAPTPVKQAFAVHNEARARQVMPLFRRSPLGDVIVEKTHGVMGINTSVGPVIIWAAPTRGGGVCWIVDIEPMRPDRVLSAGGGCNPTPLPADVPLHYGVLGTRVGNRYLQLVEGRVSVGVASVELRYPDGRTETLPVFERFFLSELQGDSRPNLIVARDARGVEVDRRKMDGSRGMLSGIPGPEDIPKQVGPERVVIRLETSTGHPLTLSLAPAEGGQLCQITRYRASRWGGCGPDRRTRVEPAELSVHPGLWNEAEDGKPLVSLNGVVGSDIARLELRYADGTVVPVPITEQFVYFEIPPAHHDDARFVLIGRDRNGVEIARRVVK